MPSTAPLSVATRSAPPQRPWIDRAERREVFEHARLSGPTIPPFTSRIRNISASGMLVDMLHPLAPGDIVTAAMAGRGEVMCRVVRTKGDTAGLKFVTGV